MFTARPGRPEPRRPRRPAVLLEPLEQLRRCVLADAGFRAGEQAPLVDPGPPPLPVQHVALGLSLRGQPLPVHLVFVLGLCGLPAAAGPFLPRDRLRAGLLTPVDLRYDLEESGLVRVRIVGILAKLAVEVFTGQGPQIPAVDPHREVLRVDPVPAAALVRARFPGRAGRLDEMLKLVAFVVVAAEDPDPLLDRCHHSPPRLA